MWYIIKNLPHAHLLVGLKHELSPQTYSHLVAKGTIADALSSYEVAPGDCFYLPPGRVHSIGAGCFLAEIQQTCDLTYRIFDFNRRDKNGNLRPLHTALAAEAINYNVLPDYQTHYVPRLNEPTSLVSTPYFKTSVCTLSQSKTFSYADIDSFIILVAVGGSATLSVDNTSAVNFRSGESIVLPAAAKTVLLTPTSADFRFLETYV
jgi:mannose-6-phosphate isomerase